ncbi:uncharacterized protein LOC123412099 [Hordeum vulgare subsp. vulgare]|uniref:uncharacterized protein LOC123412099 n=1 Tax=Hordeum vulgare subsp. vulgare TaxID=112509 RepID=UPI001D1A5A8A|nr:uncharacterized protein LOC123412099 [Hordeum vulgare subsp. vulgare]
MLADDESMVEEPKGEESEGEEAPDGGWGAGDPEPAVHNIEDMEAMKEDALEVRGWTWQMGHEPTLELLTAAKCAQGKLSAAPKLTPKRAARTQPDGGRGGGGKKACVTPLGADATACDPHDCQG